MANSKELKVTIIGDADKLNRSFRQASDSAGSFGNKMMKVGKVAALGLAGGIAAAAYGMKKSIDAAIEAEKAQTRLDSAFKAAGVTAKQNAQAMAEVSRVSVKAGLDDEDLMDTLGRLTRVTGSAAKAQKDMAIAADLARARNLSLEAATKIVEKAELGNVGALKRIGIEIPKVTAAQDALKASHEKVSAEQMKQAKATDDLATRQSAVAALQSQYAGSAEAYGKTAAGAQDRFRVAVENLQESVGAKLLPVLTKFLTWVVANMPAFERITAQVFQKVGAVIDALKPTFAVLIAGIARVADFAQDNWPKVQEAAAKVVAWYKGTLQPAIQNVVAVITAIWNRFGDDIIKVASTAFKMVSTVVRNGLAILQAAVEVVLAVIRGDWSEAWNGLKTIVSKTLNSVSTIVSGFVTIAYTAAKAIGSAIVGGIVDGITGLATSVGNKIKSGVQAGIDAAKGFFGIHSPSTVTRDEIGKPLAEGVVQGMDGGLALLAPAMKTKIEAAVKRAQAVVDAAKTRMQASFSLLSDKLMKAFDAETSGHQTPAEAMLAQISDRRQTEDLQHALQEAMLGGDTEAIARAQEDIQIAALQKQAENERRAYEDQRDALREQLGSRLTALTAHFEKEGGTVADAMLRINKIMRAFGITFAESGQLIGAQFVKGLQTAIGGAAAGAAGVHGALTGGNANPSMPPIVTQILLDGKVVAETVRNQNAIYQRANVAV